MRYLADTSALVRIWRKQVDPQWHKVASSGLIAICEPVLAESLLAARAKDYAETEAELCDVFLMVTIPDDIWTWTATIRQELAQHSAHQATSVADLVVAATGIRLKLEVLHEDHDFETVARHVPELRQRRISTGPE